MWIQNGFEEFFSLHYNLSNDNTISAKRPGLKTGMDFRGLVWKSVWKMTFFGQEKKNDDIRFLAMYISSVCQA